MVKRIPAGMFRHQVTLQTQSTALDSYGQTSASTTAWGNDDTVRAHITTLSGREVEIARQIYPSATHRVTIEYLSSMDSTGATRKRVLFGERALFIGHVNNPDMENWHLELLCGEER